MAWLKNAKPMRYSRMIEMSRVQRGCNASPDAQRNASGNHAQQVSDLRGIRRYCSNRTPHGRYPEAASAYETNSSIQTLLLAASVYFLAWRGAYCLSHCEYRRCETDSIKQKRHAHARAMFRHIVCSYPI